MPFIKNPPIKESNKYIKVRIINNELTRCCRYCGEFDCLFYYYFNKKQNVNIYTNVCEGCHKKRKSESDAKYRLAHPEKIKLKSKKYESENREYRNKYKAELRRKNNPSLKLYRIYRKRKEDKSAVEWFTKINKEGLTQLTYKSLFLEK